MQLTHKDRFSRLDILVLAIVILIGLIHLPYPFGPDQALFTVGGTKMSHGAILYRDFAVLSQPAVHIFYFLAGSLFGFSEVGIHTFELVYTATFSLVLAVTLKEYYQKRTVASLVPILTVGMYYCVSGSWHLTQVEALVGFPIFLSMWAACKGSRCCGFQTRWYLLSGFMGGIALLFKFVFLPILVAFWLSAVVDALVFRRQKILRSLLRIALPAALGTSLPLLIVLGYYASHVTLKLLYWTFVEHTARILVETSGSRFHILMDGLSWFSRLFSPLMALACLGVYQSFSQKRDSLMTINLVLWLVLGIGVIMLQRLSWWQYHYLLLFVPLGILAAKGLEFLWQQIERGTRSIALWKWRIVVFASLTLLFSAALGSLAAKSLSLVRYGFAYGSEKRLKYQIRLSDNYKTAAAEVAFLSDPGSLPGDIYVCGNPIYYVLSGRGQAIPLNGFVLELWLPTLSERLKEELTKALPPYIFVSTDYVHLIQSTSPQTARFIAENYGELRRSNAGVWYVLQEPLTRKAG